ncbi:MAG: CoA-binding protein [Candidatus Helarchaeota archaeon]
MVDISCESGLKKFRQIEYFFNPKSIALIGAGKVNPLAVSNIILSNILAEGYIGSTYLVDIKPEADVLKGLRIYSSIYDLPQKTDLALIIVPGSVVPNVITQCIEAHVKAIIIITAGFSESIQYDKLSKNLQEQLETIVQNSNTRIVGPNCNGVYSKVCSLNATLGPRVILPEGHFSLVTRGGTAGILLSTAAAKKNVGINKYIGIGDECDLNLQDFIQYFEYDKTTKAIGAYTEGIKNIHSFFDIIKRVQKPIILYKGGNTPSGVRAAVSHVGAISGEFTSKIIDGVSKQLKIIKANTIDEFIDFIAALTTSPLPRGRNVGIWTPGGSMGVIMSDKLESEGLQIPPLSYTQIQLLNKVLKVRYWSHNNPVDVTDSYNPQSIDKTADILLSSDNIDGLIVLFGFGFTDDADYIEFSFKHDLKDLFEVFLKQQAKRFGKLIKKYQKPIFVMAEDQSKAARMFQKAGVIVLPNFQRIARTYKMLYQQYQYTKKHDFYYQ